VRVEDLDDLREIREGAREAVDLVDDDGVDLASLDIRQEPLESWPLERAARDPAVVVVVDGCGDSLVTASSRPLF
jgi:hypothetical protein